MRQFYLQKELIFLCFLLVTITPFSNAQVEKCGFDAAMQAAKSQNPFFDQSMRELEAYTANYTRGRSGAVTKIPTVIHVIHNGEAVGTYPNISDVQIQSAITNLNDAFKNTGPYAGSNFYNNGMDIEFALAQVTPEGTATTGIERHDVTSRSYAATYNSDGISSGGSGVPQATLFADFNWNPQDYMNIWIVKEIDGVDVGTGAAGTLGYATLPLSNPGVTDGLVCQARAFGYLPSYDGSNPGATPGYDFGTTSGISGNGTADHEVGHYLNLHHTFTGDNNGTTCPPVSGTIGTDDDGCADIPPHKRTSSICPADNTTGNTCTGGHNNYIHNFMDYSSDPCFQGFSVDQRTRCHAAVDGPRKAFKTSIATVAPTGTYPAAVTASPGGGNFGFGIFDITLNGQTFTSRNSKHDGGYLNRIASQPTVVLDYATQYTMTVAVGTFNNSGNGELVDVYIDYNNDASFATSERVYQTAAGSGKVNGTFSFQFTTPASGGTTPATTRLRMRLISGFDNNVNTLSSATSTNGQIEDYSVSFGNVLPVELIDFRAKEGFKKTHLTWETATELNNSGFEIEKSTNGVDFEMIDFVGGNGTTLELQSYEYIDRAVEGGKTYYYRLKQIDFDGKFEYSKIAYVTFGDIAPELKAVAIFPNPTSSILNIDIPSSLETEGNYQILIYNILGEVVRTKNVNSGSSLVDVQGLAKGTYILRLITPNKEQQNFTFIKQ